MKSLAPIFFVLGGLLILFGDFSNSGQEDKAKELYSSLATIVENDGSRSEDKQTFKSVASIQQAEQRSLRLAYADGETTPEFRAELKSYFESTEDFEWPGYREEWIKCARKLVKGI
jgi:hypothetical protein